MDIILRPIQVFRGLGRWGGESGEDGNNRTTDFGSKTKTNFIMFKIVLISAYKHLPVNM
jgi:hypothetical protein